MNIVDHVPRSTAWARENKERVAARDKARKSTLYGKCVNLATQSRYRTKASGLEHTIDTAFIMSLYEAQHGLCALSGLPMTVIGERGSDDYWTSVSIDRIDSNLGYTEDNVQLTCTGVNLMKKDMSDEMFIAFCKAVVEHRT